MKHGIFLARMQPLHKAHLYMVKEALKENDHVSVILGSANKKDMLRNPFTIELRTRMLKDALEVDLDYLEEDIWNRVSVYEIPDWTQEDDIYNAKEWGAYLYYNIVSRIKSKTFSIYYSDDPQIMLNWFDEPFQERINFRFFERNNLFEGLSSTKIRDAILNKDLETLEKYTPRSVSKRIVQLHKIWKEVIDNPKSDFSMK